ncbi:MAG: hypothetical protein CSA33_07870 [Desulfobulbus propionicus]|nr:MAG: hypothetical protein CSA33_07870 [Desulfobulbus propionicus]
MAPGFSALVAEIGGNSRETIQTFCSSALGVPVSLGDIQKVLDRASAAITPHYHAIRDKARSQDISHLEKRRQAELALGKTKPGNQE